MSGHIELKWVVLMNKTKLQKKTQEFLEIVKTKGAGALFDDYDKNDAEGNYLKRKILSQLHYNDRSYLTDKEFEKYLKCEKGRKEYIPSKVHYDALNNLYSLNENKHNIIVEYIAIEKLLTRYADVILKAKQEELGKLQESIESSNLVKKFLIRKEIKKVNKTIKQFNQLFKKYRARKQELEPEIKEFKSANPNEYACMENVSEANEYGPNLQIHVDMMLGKRGKKCSLFNVECYVSNHVYTTGSKNALIGPIEWCERSNNVAETILTTLSLEKGLTFDEFIKATRTNFLSAEDKVSLDYRKDLLIASDVFCDNVANPEEIPELMKKLKAKFDKANFEKMTAEEIIRFAAKICWEFIKIHPYSNGNGRTSRMILDYILISNGIESPVLYTGSDSKIEFQNSMNFKSKNLSSVSFENYLLNCYNKQFGKGLDNNANPAILN